MNLTHLLQNTVLAVFAIKLVLHSASYVVSYPTESNNGTLKTGKPREGWWKSVSCFRRANFSFEDPVVRCVAPRMLKEYKKMSKINCPNCEPYFHCKANYRAVTECGQTEQAVKLANAGTNCKEISKIGADDNASFEAAAKGRNGSDCNSLYLCAVKCSYNEITGACPQASICSSSN